MLRRELWSWRMLLNCLYSLWFERPGRRMENVSLACELGSPLHLLALAEANGGREGGSEGCEGL